MTTDTVKNVKKITKLVVNFVFFETLATEKSATGLNYKWLPGITKQEGRFNQSQQAYAI